MFYLIFLFYSCQDSSLLLSNQRLIENPLGLFEIISCIFFRTTVYSSTHGSIFYLYQKECFLKINLCTFFNCTTISGSGPIYFSSDIIGSKVNILNTCGHKCTGGNTDHGHFAYIRVKNDINFQIFISLISINKSPFSNDPGSIFFNNLNHLFYIESNSLILINCKISHLNNKIIYGNINTQQSNIFTTNQIFITNLNNHFLTYLCLNEFILNSKKIEHKKILHFVIFFFKLINF